MIMTDISSCLRACLNMGRGAAAWDFGFGRGGAGGASPERAVTPVATKAKDLPPGGVSRQWPSGFVAPQSKTHKGYGLPKSCK